MYATYKYARRKYKERQANETAQRPQSEEIRLAAPDGTVRPDTSASSGPDVKVVEPEETPEERAEKKRRRTYRLKIILGLFLPFTLQALDTTIIASALKFIAEDFDELAQLNWIITAFNLLSAASLPLFAQLADIFGRHATLQTAMALILLGSALCTAAPTTAFPMLLLGRAFQGMGAAGINICVRTILADKVSLAEYAKNWTVFALVSAVGFTIGPVAGGYLTQVSWRWCFAVNLPVGVVGVGVVFWLLRGELVGPAEVVPGEREGEGQTGMGRFVGRLKTIDYGGQGLFLWGVGLLVLAFTWAGSTYAWDSAAVVATLVVGGVLTVAWLVYEWAMVPGRVMARVFPRQKPMMPWELLMQGDIKLLFVINFAGGAAMFAVMYFMDLYFTLVLGHGSSDAGLALLYYLPGLGGGIYLTILFVNKWPRQTFPILLFGSICSAVGMTVMPFACESENTNLVYGIMALIGFGVGVNVNPSSLHGLAYFPGMTAPITCLVTFATPFGGTVTLTIMSTVFNNKSGLGHLDVKTGIMWAYIAIIPIMWVGVLATLCLGNVWIGENGRHQVVHGSWLWSLLTGRKLEKVTMARMEDANSTTDDTDGHVHLKTVTPSGPALSVDIERGR